jgi:hypothetical protein
VNFLTERIACSERQNLSRGYGEVFPIIVEESTKLNAEVMFTFSIENVPFRDVVLRIPLLFTMQKQ